MRLKKLFSTLLVLGACTIFSASSFANEVQVLWDKQAVNGIPYQNEKYQSFVDEEILSEVGTMVDDKLEALESQGRLPFKTSIIDSYKNNDWQSKMNAEEAIALVPVITADFNSDKFVQYNGVNYYSYDIRAELNILLCTFDGTNLKIIHNLPLANQAILGGSLAEALTKPLTREDLKKQYIHNLKQLIESIEFPQSVVQKLMDTSLAAYQVKDVVLGDSIKKEDLERLEKVAKPVIASTYTSKYAEKFKDRCVLPSSLASNKWKKEVVKHIASSDIAASEYNPDMEDNDSIEIFINFNKFTIEIDEKNPYRVTRDLNIISDLEAFEKGNKGKFISLGKVDTKTNYKLPKTLEFKATINWLKVFDDAAFELGMQLDKIKVKK